MYLNNLLNSCGMNKSIEKTVALLRNIYSGKHVDKEKELENAGVKRVFGELGNDECLEGELRRYGSFDVERGVRLFRDRQRKRKIRLWGSRVAVAASVVIVMFSMWMLSGKDVEMQEVKYATTAIGEREVWLKLADGREVAVRHDQRDVVEEQGSTLIRMENGSLTYEAVEGVVNEEAEIKYNELRVPRGGECYLILDDGTKVWLNADSYLRYPVHFGKNSRQVEIRGEGYFEVKADGRPFSVDMGCGRVNVLGTSFGVRVYPNEMAMTTLVTGKVAFAAPDGQRIEMTPGEQVRIGVNGEVSKQRVDVDEYVAWRDGWFVFREERLENVMEMMCRWYDVEVFYQSAVIKEVRFTGNLKRYDSIETFLEVLASPGRVKYRVTGRTVVLYE